MQLFFYPNDSGRYLKPFLRSPCLRRFLGMKTFFNLVTNGAFVACFFLSFACKNVKKQSFPSSSAPFYKNSRHLGLSFSAGDIRYTSSDGFFYDFHKGEIRSFAYGQSGDSYLSYFDKTLFFMNRSPTRYNYMSYSLAENNSFFLKQVISKDFEQGDPHCMLPLRNGNFLLSYYGKGKVAEFNPHTGAEVRELVFSDFGSGRFHPSDMMQQNIAGTDYIFISHIGLTYDPALGTMSGNGSQKIYLAQDAGAAGAVVVNGGLAIAAPYASSGRFLHKKHTNPAFFGLCAQQTVNCQQGLQYLSLEGIPAGSYENLLTEAIAMDQDDFSSNGLVVDGFGHEEFFASVVSGLKGSAARKLVIKITLEPEERVLKTSLEYEYSTIGNGSYLLVSDESTQTLFIGDAIDETSGKLLSISADNMTTTRLDRIPYYGILIPDE